MRNVGETKLVLPNNWQWNIKVNTKNYQGEDEVEIEVRAERGVWVSEDGRVSSNCSMSSGSIHLFPTKDYDTIIEEVQRAVDRLEEGIKYWDVYELTPVDALRDIIEVFATHTSAAKTLHLYDADTPVKKKLDWELHTDDDQAMREEADDDE